MQGFRGLRRGEEEVTGRFTTEVFFQMLHELPPESPVPAGRVHNQLAYATDSFSIQAASDGRGDTPVFRIFEDHAVPRLLLQIFQGLLQRRNSAEPQPLRHFSEGEELKIQDCRKIFLGCLQDHGPHHGSGKGRKP